MQGVTYLTQQPEVDSKRIAVLGYSMGSFVAGITGAIEYADSCGAAERCGGVRWAGRVIRFGQSALPGAALSRAGEDRRSHRDPVTR